MLHIIWKTKSALIPQEEVKIFHRMSANFGPMADLERITGVGTLDSLVPMNVYGSRRIISRAVPKYTNPPIDVDKAGLSQI